MARRASKVQPGGWAKVAFAVLLLPACWSTAVTFGRAVSATPQGSTFWISVITGAALWMVCFLNLPKPMWVYVVGHELTHVIWTWIFGGRVKAFRASSGGGHVVISKSNFVITLSPYFFPIYALAWMGFFWIGDRIWDWSRFLPVLHVGLGATYAFHLTLTWHVLQVRQPDLVSEGVFFSVVIIWIGNLLVLTGALTALAKVTTWSAAATWFGRDLIESYGCVLELLTRVVR